jgi:hypothetical protein
MKKKEYEGTIDGLNKLIDGRNLELVSRSIDKNSAIESGGKLVLYTSKVKHAGCELGRERKKFFAKLVVVIRYASLYDEEYLETLQYRPPENEKC